MSLGYGRGHYGGEQLERPPRSGGGWFKVVAVVGLGAAVWYVWPRKRPPSSPPMTGEASNEHEPKLEQIARAGGFASAQEYEDATLATARALAATGAKIELPPHLQHLAPRLQGL